LNTDVSLYCNTLRTTFEANSNIRFERIELLELLGEGEKYVGAVTHGNGNVYCIPNGTQSVLEYDVTSGEIDTFGYLPGLDFSYTGGAWYQKDNCIYGFSRNSNNLLRIDVEKRTVQEIPLKLDYATIGGLHNHHYAGTIGGDYLYCAPRSAEHILRIRLTGYEITRIELPFFQDYYNGAIALPNGMIVFIPHTNGHVLKLNPETLQLTAIGNPVPNSYFSGVVYSDGCVYSFGNSGILKIDPINNTAEVVCMQTDTGVKIRGFYGTKLHFNGKLYGIIGHSNDIIEYNPSSNTAIKVGEFNDGKYNYAKYAGGALLKDGNILLTPAFGRFVAKYVFSQEPILSAEMCNLLKSPYLSGY